MRPGHAQPLRRICRQIILSAALLCATAASATAQGFTAKGLDNPTLAFNTGGTADYIQAMQFIDIAKMMRPWIGHLPGQWGGVKYDALIEGGHLDKDGWVRRLPKGVRSVGTLWQWNKQPEMARHRTGIYDLRYDGEGTLTLSGDAKILERTPGQISFENRKGTNIFLEIEATDPNGTGNYIRNIRIIPRKHAALYAAGGRFNPDWLALVQDARHLRFMIWQKTNNSQRVTWADHPTEDGPFTGRGIPLSYMVKLANEVGADPWFTMPHQANADYVRRFAEYARDHVDPRLVIRVEYSNETWNWAFGQAKWLEAQSKANWWGKGERHAYHTKKATETALIWNEVFGPSGRSRLSHVMGSQAMNVWASEQRLEARAWRRNERRAYIPPEEVFDELAITHYFGSPTVAKEEMRAELIAAIKNPQVDATDFLTAKLMDPDYRGSIPASAAAWAKQAALAREHGMGLIAYEGGQHVHHSFAVKGLNKADIAALTAFMTDFVRSPQMADLYKASWRAWANVSTGPFMQFTEISHVSKWGSWGLRSGLEDTSPRAKLVDRLNARSTPWWDTPQGAQYQHGVIKTGTAQRDRLRGTREEDYLLGQGGDDILRPGPGNDGVHGGAGHDVVHLSGARDQYTLRAIDGGIELRGPDGINQLISIEEVQFAQGPAIAVSQLLQDAPQN